jgi:hypothetical protein
MDRLQPVVASHQICGHWVSRGGFLAILLAVSIAHANTLILFSASDETWAADVRTKLQSTGRIAGNIDMLNARTSTPSLASLQPYDSILLFSHNNWQNASALGNTLANYVDGGGGLVISMLTLANIPVTGRLQSGGYYPILSTGAMDGQFTRLTLGTVHHPASPLMADVHTLDGGSNSFHSPGGLAPAATLIAGWSNGQPLVATLGTFSGPVVALNFFPVSSDKRADFWDPATDGAILMANAINYTAGNILPGEDDPPAAVPLPAAVWAGAALLALLAARRLPLWNLRPTAAQRRMVANYLAYARIAGR